MAMVICRYPDGSERIVDSGVSLGHAQGMARHYAELDGGESGCVWFASEEDRSPVKVPRHVLGGIEAVRSSVSIREKRVQEVLERLLDIEVTEYGTVTEEVERICCMTGFR